MSEQMNLHRSARDYDLSHHYDALLFYHRYGFIPNKVTTCGPINTTPEGDSVGIPKGYYPKKGFTLHREKCAQTKEDWQMIKEMKQ